MVVVRQIDDLTLTIRAVELDLAGVENEAKWYDIDVMPQLASMSRVERAKAMLELAQIEQRQLGHVVRLAQRYVELAELEERGRKLLGEATECTISQMFNIPVAGHQDRSNGGLITEVPGFGTDSRSPRPRPRRPIGVAG